MKFFLVGSSFLEIIFQNLLCLFSIRKINQQRIFSSQRKIWLGFQESVFFLRKILFRSCEKFRNIILFADYNKFGP